MFDDEYKAANEGIRPSQDARQRTLDAMNTAQSTGGKPTGDRRRMRRWVVSAVAACLVIAIPIALIGSIWGANRTNQARDRSSTFNFNYPAGYTEAEVSAYSTVYDMVSAIERMKLQSMTYEKPGIFDMWFGKNKADAALEDASGTADGMLDSELDYSETNTQVEGVDEADIVKTDGRYIYALGEAELNILTAAGKDSELIASVNADMLPRTSNIDGTTFSFIEMYVISGKVILISQEETPSETVTNGDLYTVYMGAAVTGIHAFDISDARYPRHVSSVFQDGYYSDSRLTEGQLYIVTNYFPTFDVEEDDIATYVPCMYGDDMECRVIPSSDIYISDDEPARNDAYTFITRLDVDATDDFADEVAVLGYASIMYCSGSSIVLTQTEYAEETVETDGDAANVRRFQKTTLYRIPLGTDDLCVDAVGEISGTPLNQFALDEYNGYLRIVCDRQETYEVRENDPHGGYASMSLIKENRDTCLYVLDTAMNVVGSIENIAPDERVYSVRFMGDVGYFVTFRQVDPLFSVDLSVPTEPKILGELKIPGFSEYLHPWGEGMLFGFGKSADENTGAVLGLKLSMFDVSDPANVSQVDCIEIPDSFYSEASYNHKAILVSYDRGIIGFPCDTGYALYTYDDEHGFIQQGIISYEAAVDTDGEGLIESYFINQGRGLYVNDYYYIVDAFNGIMVMIDLNTFSLLGTVVF